jgi:hypothetical protein
MNPPLKTTGLFLTPRGPYGRRLPERARKHMRASDTVPMNPDKKPQLSPQEMQGLAGQMAPGFQPKAMPTQSFPAQREASDWPKASSPQGLGAQMAPNEIHGDNSPGMKPRQKLSNSGMTSPPAESSPAGGSLRQQMYSPADNARNDSSGNGGQEKFFPKNEAGGHIGVWGEISDGKPSGAIGYSSKGWEYGAPNPITDGPERDSPVEHRSIWDQYIYDSNYLNNNPKGDPKKPIPKPAPKYRK